MDGADAYVERAVGCSGVMVFGSSTHTRSAAGCFIGTFSFVGSVSSGNVLGGEAPSLIEMLGRKEAVDAREDLRNFLGIWVC